MATKTISITEEAYERLKMRKEPKESFTDAINRITGKRNILEFAGILTDKDAEQMKAHIKKRRQASRERLNKIRDALK